MSPRPPSNTSHADSPLDSNTHLPALDGVRGLAILLILIHHTFLLPGVDNKIDRMIENLTRPLWMGVEIFFVLSGFLVTRALVQAWQKPGYYWKFYVRRATRILPLYYIALLLFLVVAPLFPGPTLDVYRTISHEERLSFWLFYMNYYYALTWSSIYLGHFWALCVEMHFYLVWPLVIRFCRGRFLWAAVIGILSTTALRVLAIETGWWTRELGYHATHLRMDSILMGALAYWVYQNHRDNQQLSRWLQRLLPVMFAVSFVVILIGRPRSSAMGNLIGFPVINLTMAVFLLAALGRFKSGFLNKALLSRPLHHLGKFSYAIYIFHYPMLQVAALALWGGSILPLWHGMTWPAAIVTAIVAYAATWCIAWLSWHALEKRHYAPPPPMALPVAEG